MSAYTPPGSTALTPAQRRVLDYCRRYQGRCGRLPVLRMIARVVLGGRGPNAARQHVLALRRKGYLPSPCRHCRARDASRARSLCWDCSRDAGVRALYPGSTHRGATRSPVADFYGPAPPPAEATDAPPGSERKVAVLAERAAAGRALFDERDCGMTEWRDRLTRGRAACAGRVHKVGVA